jgi:hypothetical protein
VGDVTTLRSCASPAALCVLIAAAGASSTHHPLSFLEPLVSVDEPQRLQLVRGEPLIAVLPGSDGHLSLSAIMRVDTDADRVARWARDVSLQKGRYVESVGRFSTRPQVSDLAGLTFEAEDLADLARCRPGKCAVKVSAEEMTALQVAAGPDRAARLQAALGAALVRRANAYLSDGDRCASPFIDHKEPVAPAVVADALLQRLEFLPRRFPGLVDYLRRYPHVPDRHVTDSFLYWSKETLGVKPIVSVTHVTIARFDEPHLPEVLVIARQVFANHYRNGAVTVTALTGRGAERYLVYIQRAHVDVLQGFFGSVARRMLERRVKDEAPGVLFRLRELLERPVS